MISADIKPSIIDYPGDIIIEAYAGEAFLGNRDVLTRECADSAHKEVGWSEKVARDILSKGLETDHLEDESEIPSVLVFREKGADPEKYFGLSAARMYHVRALGQIVPVLYHVYRGFDEDYRGHHYGRFAVQQHRLIHGGSKWYVHRSASPIAIVSVLETNLFEKGYRYPYDNFLNTNPFAQEIDIHVHTRVRINSVGQLDYKTAVAPNEYSEVNKSAQPRKGHNRTEDMLNFMKNVLKMKICRGDALYPVLKFK